LPGIVPFELIGAQTDTALQDHIWAILGRVKPPAQKFGNFAPVYACGKRFTSAVLKMVEIGAG